MIEPKPQIYFKNVAGQWLRHAQSSADAPIKVFSPYITGPKTLRLVEARENAEVYTLFDAELFISRASSLAELKKMLNAQVSVYLLPGLHAKIVWIPGIYLTIGSQNLTYKGMKNKEATVTISHTPWMAEVEDALEHWTQERKPITLDMVEDMANAIAQLLPAFQQLQVQLIQIDEAVKTAEAEREQQRQRTAEKQEQKRLFQQSFKQLHVSGVMVAKVKKFPTGRVSLVAPLDHSFLRWVINGNTFFLYKFKRYLCVVPELGRLGWARVSQGFISFVESSVQKESAIFLGEKCRTTWSAKESLEAGGHNLTFEITGHPTFHSHTFKLWIDANQIKHINAQDADKKTLSRWEEISTEIVRHLTLPFKYNQKLTGKKADQFFDAEEDSEFRVRLALLAGHEILVVEAVYRD